jgi:lipopolysaccharide biosynthesis protein
MTSEPRSLGRETDAAPRVVAFYLPQFHPIPENDEWWGKGFTEWTNTAKARPRFWGHYQPHVPRDLGFYDLRVPETRAAQAALAKAYDVSAFCYYHYWFAGRRILERPLNDVVASGEPDLPFCVCWANESWTGVWHGAPKRVLIEQTYPGLDDHRAHFDELMRYFADPRYLRIDGKPLFMIYQPWQIPDLPRAIELWRRLAQDAGLGDLHMVAWAPTDHTRDPRPLGMDALASGMPNIRYDWNRPVQKTLATALHRLGLPYVYRYRDMVTDLLRLQEPGHERYPCVIPNWDNSPRSGRRGLVLSGATPVLFRSQVQDALRRAAKLPASRRLVFVKSWNEWAEGNHLEPDMRDGLGYLEVLRDEVARVRKQRV